METVDYQPLGPAPHRLLEQETYDTLVGHQDLAFSGCGGWHYTPSDYVTEVFGRCGTVTLTDPVPLLLGGTALIRLYVPGDAVPINVRVHEQGAQRCQRLPNGGWYIEIPEPPAPQTQGPGLVVTYTLHAVSSGLAPGEVARLHALYHTVRAQEPRTPVDYSLLPALPQQLLRHIRASRRVLSLQTLWGLLKAFMLCFFPVAEYQPQRLQDHKALPYLP